MEVEDAWPQRSHLDCFMLNKTSFIYYFYYLYNIYNKIFLLKGERKQDECLLTKRTEINNNKT